MGLLPILGFKKGDMWAILMSQDLTYTWCTMALGLFACLDFPEF